MNEFRGRPVRPGYMYVEMADEEPDPDYRVTDVDYVNRHGNRVTGTWVCDDDPRHWVDLTPPPE